MTVLEAIQRSADFLSRKGIDSPRLQAELLLAWVLRVPRMRLYLDFERALTPDEIEACRGAVARRGKREPLQHIVGSTGFCGLEILVNRHALVPRPETELLAEHGWVFLTTLCGEHPAESCQPLALDWGTGSGCVAVALAVKCPTARVCAADRSGEALLLARENAVRHQVSDRVAFFEGDSFAGLPPDLRFHLIISNPPYIPTGEIPALAPEVRDFDPRPALDGGDDGLELYRRLARESGERLLPGGKLMLELGDGQAAAVSTLLAEQNWVVETIEPDYNRVLRILVARPGQKSSAR